MKHEERGAERGAVGNRDPSRTRRGSRSPRTATASVEAIDCLSGASPEAGKRGADEIRHIAGANSGPVEMFHVKHHLRPEVGRHTETFSVVRPTTRYRRCRPNGPRSGTAQLLGLPPLTHHRSNANTATRNSPPVVGQAPPSPHRAHTLRVTQTTTASQWTRFVARSVIGTPP